MFVEVFIVVLVIDLIEMDVVFLFCIWIGCYDFQLIVVKVLVVKMDQFWQGMEMFIQQNNVLLIVDVSINEVEQIVIMVGEGMINFFMVIGGEGKLIGECYLVGLV